MGESFPKVTVACGDRSHGNWRVPGGDDAADLFVAIRTSFRNDCSDQNLKLHTYIGTVICPRRPLTPSTAPGRARAARGQQRGTIYWQTGRVCLQPGGLLCGSRPPPQLKGWRSGWTPPARTRRAKGNGHRTLPDSTNFPSGAWGGVRGGAEFYFMLCHQSVMGLLYTRRSAWSRRATRTVVTGGPQLWRW